MWASTLGVVHSTEAVAEYMAEMTGLSAGRMRRGPPRGNGCVLLRVAICMG